MNATQLEYWLEADKKSFGCEPISQNVTFLSDKLTWDMLVTSGTLKLVEKGVRRSAENILKEKIPSWIPRRHHIEVVTRRGWAPDPSVNIVQTCAYLVEEEKECECHRED